MLKVVIADDEKKICQLLRVIVDWQALGYEIVAVAHNGLQALEYVRKYEPDLLVTDIQMPELSGIELLHKIREELRDIDVLIISGYREFEYARQALQDGAEDYLLKPIRKAELESTLRNIFTRRKKKTSQQEEFKSVQKALTQSVDKLHASLVREIAAGHITHMSATQMNREYHCAFEGQCQLFATVRVDLEDMVQQKTGDVLQRKIRSIVQSSLCDAGITAYCDNLSDLTVHILLDLKEGCDPEPYFYRIIYSIKDFMGKMSRSRVVVGVCRVTNNALHDASRKSQMAVMDQIFRGSDRILEYKEPDYETNPTVFVNDISAAEIKRGLTTLSSEVLSGAAGQVIEQVRAKTPPILSGANVYFIMRALQQQIKAHQLIQEIANSGTAVLLLSQYRGTKGVSGIKSYLLDEQGLIVVGDLVETVI